MCLRSAHGDGDYDLHFVRMLKGAESQEWENWLEPVYIRLLSVIVVGRYVLPLPSSSVVAHSCSHTYALARPTGFLLRVASFILTSTWNESLAAKQRVPSYLLSRLCTAGEENASQRVSDQRSAPKPRLDSLNSESPGLPRDTASAVFPHGSIAFAAPSSSVDGRRSFFLLFV